MAPVIGDSQVSTEPSRLLQDVEHPESVFLNATFMESAGVKPTAELQRIVGRHVVNLLAFSRLRTGWKTILRQIGDKPGPS